MHLILVFAGASAYLAARVGWTLAGVAHQSTKDRTAAGRREHQRGVGR